MIELRNLCVDLGDFVLRDANLDIKVGEYFIILGPTGAGKTVLLESIAGLYTPQKGQIFLHGREITKLEPEKRGISIVYQDQVLFSHLNVEDNVTFGLRLRKKSRVEIKESLDWLVNLLGISHLLHRKPDTLSGGEKQKVALARALSIKPQLRIASMSSVSYAVSMTNYRSPLSTLPTILRKRLLLVTESPLSATGAFSRQAPWSRSSVNQILSLWLVLPW